jgi:hypothetical protein
MMITDVYREKDEHILRKRIQELQEYRRLGLKTAADIDKYEQDLIKRVRGVLSSGHTLYL